MWQWQWAAKGNIQQHSYIPQAEQHLPFVLMLLCLENVANYYVHVHVCTLNSLCHFIFLVQKYQLFHY